MIRSWFLVAAEVLALESALAAGADRLVIDLAGCESGSEQQAREIAAGFLRAHRAAAGLPTLCVRIHGFASGEAEADVAAVVSAGAAAILLPAAASGATVQRLDVGLSVAEARAGLEAGVTAIVAISGDNPAGLLQAGGFAGKSRRLTGLGWDAAALATALGARRVAAEAGGWSGPMATARATLLLTAADCGAAAIDTVSPAGPPALFRRLCLAARADGFSGKMTRDRAQLDTINAVFGDADPGR